MTEVVYDLAACVGDDAGSGREYKNSVYIFDKAEAMVVLVGGVEGRRGGSGERKEVPEFPSMELYVSG